MASVEGRDSVVPGKMWQVFVVVGWLMFVDGKKR